MKKLKKLTKGKSMNVKGDSIVDVIHHTPNISPENYKKLEKAYEKNKGCRLKLSESELIGCGLGEVINDVKKVGKTAMKSGIVDVAIDEAVNLAPVPSIAKKVASKAIKYEAHKLTGTGLKPSANPYLPDSLGGGSLEKFGIPIKNGSNSSNIVPVSSDAFHPSVYNLSTYANPLGYELYHNK